MLKLKNLSKVKDGNNSAFECGKIINLIFKYMNLQNSKVFPIVSGYREQIVKKIKVYFDYFNKVIIEMYELKSTSFMTQKFEVFYK